MGALIGIFKFICILIIWGDQFGQLLIANFWIISETGVEARLQGIYLVFRLLVFL